MLSIASLSLSSPFSSPRCQPSAATLEKCRPARIISCLLAKDLSQCEPRRTTWDALKSTILYLLSPWRSWLKGYLVNTIVVMVGRLASHDFITHISITMVRICGCSLLGTLLRSLLHRFLRTTTSPACTMTHPQLLNVINVLVIHVHNH
jgi:hypothetical protein